MLTLKEGCVLVGNQYTNTMLIAIQQAFDLVGVDVVITSGQDSHQTGYHPLNRALDVRSLKVSDKLGMVARLRSLLPPFYDVLYEPAVVKDGKIVKGEHFHLEADAKKETSLIGVS